LKIKIFKDNNNTLTKDWMESSLDPPDLVESNIDLSFFKKIRIDFYTTIPKECWSVLSANFQKNPIEVLQVLMQISSCTKRKYVIPENIILQLASILNGKNDATIMYWWACYIIINQAIDGNPAAVTAVSGIQITNLIHKILASPNGQDINNVLIQNWIKCPVPAVRVAVIATLPSWREWAFAYGRHLLMYIW